MSGVCSSGIIITITTEQLPVRSQIAMHRINQLPVCKLIRSFSSAKSLCTTDSLGRPLTSGPKVGGMFPFEACFEPSRLHVPFNQAPCSKSYQKWMEGDALSLHWHLAAFRCVSLSHSTARFPDSAITSALSVHLPALHLHMAVCDLEV